MSAERVEALRLEVQRLDKALREKVAEDADWHETLAALERGRLRAAACTCSHEKHSHDYCTGNNCQ